MLLAAMLAIVFLVVGVVMLVSEPGAAGDRTFVDRSKPALARPVPARQRAANWAAILFIILVLVAVFIFRR